MKTRLDSTSWCEARYRGGVRSYKLKDEKWNGGEIDFVAIASQSSEAAMFDIKAINFNSDISVVINCCKTKRKGSPKANLFFACFAFFVPHVHVRAALSKIV